MGSPEMWRPLQLDMNTFLHSLTRKTCIARVRLECALACISSVMYLLKRSHAFLANQGLATRGFDHHFLLTFP